MNQKQGSFFVDEKIFFRFFNDVLSDFHLILMFCVYSNSKQNIERMSEDELFS